MNHELAVKQIQHQSWALMVQQQLNSGLTISEWCNQNGINQKTFEYRKRVVRLEMLDTVQPSFAELPVPTPNVPLASDIPTSNSVFIPVASLEVNGVTINVSGDTPKQLIADILEVLRNA